MLSDKKIKILFYPLNKLGVFNESKKNLEEFVKELNISFESTNRWKNNKNETTMKIKRKLEKYFYEWEHVVSK